MDKQFQNDQQTERDKNKQQPQQQQGDQAYNTDDETTNQPQGGVSLYEDEDLNMEEEDRWTAPEDTNEQA